MPRKVRRADLVFLASGPSGLHLRRIWRKLPLREDGLPAWPAPSLLTGRSDSNLQAEVEAAMEEGALLPIEQIALLPRDWNLVLFSPDNWNEPAAIVEGDLIRRYVEAIEYQEPLLFETEALFGPFFWKLSASDELLDDEHLRLEFLDAVDTERRRYERLQRRHDSAQGPISDHRRQRIPEEVRIFVWRRDEGRCVTCGSQDHLEFDHVIPVSRGGANTARNIQLLCERCNREKGANV